MNEELSSLVRYEAYLRQVMDAATAEGEPFGDVKDVLARHATLRSTNSDLQEQNTAVKDALEALRVQVSGSQKRLRDTALVAGSAVQSLAQRLEATRGELVELNAAQETVDAGTRRERGTLGATDAAIRNLVARVVATAPPNCLAVAPVMPGGRGGSSGGGEDRELGESEVAPTGPPLPAVLQSGPGAYLVTALDAVGARLSDLIAIRAEHAAWRVRFWV